MVEFRWIQMFLHLILVLQFTAVTRQHNPSFTARDGDEVTLPCGNVINDHHRCDRATWLLSRFFKSAAVALFEHGRIVENAKAESDRLSVTENCSLVIKKVRAEDVGRYFCSKSGEQSSHTLDLSVINMTEHKDDDEVTLKCSVSTREQCGHNVKWLFKGVDVDKDNKDLRTSKSYCSANVTFRTSHFIYMSMSYELLQCKVTDGDKVQMFTFSPLSSVGSNTTAPGNNNTTAKPQDQWWLYIIVAVGLAALFITVVALIRWKRNKGNRQMGENMDLSLNPAETQSGPETSQDTADPEDVSYASIHHTRTNSKAWVRDGGDAVTYSAVKAYSSSAGGSADPRDLYATVN